MKKILIDEDSFFYQPDCDANFEFYGKKLRWPLYEAAALILGKDPEKVNDSTLIGYEQTDFYKKYNEIIDLAWEHFMGDSYEKALNPTPVQFITWAFEMGYQIPSGLEQVINGINYRAAQKKYGNVLSQFESEIKTLKCEVERLTLENLQLREEKIEPMDQEDEYYSLELDIANITQRAIIKNPDNSKTVKQQSENFIKKNFSYLKPSARKRISILLNPTNCKSGGRPKSKEET